MHDFFSSEEMKQFLADVRAQIQYKPIHSEIEEELKAHIEDRVTEYMDLGMEEEEALHKALTQMGDASVIGIRLNEVRHTKNPRILLLMIFAAVFLGILNNLWYYRADMQQGILWYISDILRDTNYFAWGLVLLAVVYFKGYTFIVKHSKLLLTVFAALCILERLILVLNNHFQFKHYSSHVISYGWLLLFCPVLVTMAYHLRRKEFLVILLHTLLITGMILLQYRTSYQFVLSAVLILVITSFISMIYMISRGYIFGNKMRLAAFSLAGFLLTLTIYGAVSLSDQNSNLQLFLTPDKQAVNHWSDGYNGVLIKELISKASMIGPVKLSQEKLMEYGTGAWYFNQEEVDEITHYLHYDETSVKLTDILPQHYHNNYRFTYWILTYGWLPTLVLSFFVFGISGFLFVTSFKINNKLGHILSFNCSLCLTIQMLLYLLGNLGFQYGYFSTLPFISEGMNSITVNMALAGIVLSAYRYDKVIQEDSYMKR